MVFPALFASGMALVDTLDNVLMVGAYGWAFSKPQRKLYYNMIITATSVVVALFIGGLEALGLLMDKFALSGGVWRWVGALNDNLGDAGFVVVGLFVVCWALSVLNYRWRGYDNLARWLFSRLAALSRATDNTVARLRRLRRKPGKPSPHQLLEQRKGFLHFVFTHHKGPQLVSASTPFATSPSLAATIFHVRSSRRVSPARCSGRSGVFTFTSIGGNVSSPVCASRFYSGTWR